MARSVNYAGRLRADQAEALLVPGYAAKPPAAVAKAQTEAAKQVAALERAEVAWGEATRAAEAAPAVDARAAAMAHRDGLPLPEPTEQAARAAAEAAHRTRELCKREADRAICGLHDQIAAHRDQWQPATEAATDNARDAALAWIDQGRQAFADLTATAAVERGLRRFDQDSESHKVRTLRPVGREHTRAVCAASRAF